MKKINDEDLTRSLNGGTEMLLRNSQCISMIDLGQKFCSEIILALWHMVVYFARVPPSRAKTAAAQNLE